MAAEPTEVAAPKPQAVVKTIKTFVYEQMKTIEEALPRIGLTAEAVARTALSQVYKNPVLGTCDHISVVRAIIEAASLGLSFALGRAYLVPFNNKVVDPVTGRESWRMEAQMMPGYQGLLDLVRRSAGVKTVIAAAVFDGDEFEYETGLTEDKFHYKKTADDTDEAKLTHAFCIIRFLDGGYQFVVLDRKKLDKIRATSKAGSGPSAPWVAWFEEMCVKSVVKRTAKLCPASIDLARAIELDDAREIGARQQLAVDISLPGDPEPAQLTGATQPTIDAPPPESATQRVSARAAEVLQKVRETEPAETEKVRGRPPLCHVCKAGALRSVFERETKKCDACRLAETEALREANGTSVAAIEQDDEVPPTDDADTAVDALVKRLRFALMTKEEGNLPKAELELSVMTGGKVQKFEKLAAFLRENPQLIAAMTEAIR